jgi:hypothetical protein
MPADLRAANAQNLQNVGAAGRALIDTQAKDGGTGISSTRFPAKTFRPTVCPRQGNEETAAPFRTTTSSVAAIPCSILLKRASRVRLISLRLFVVLCLLR